jgi:hypothetical protein
MEIGSIIQMIFAMDAPFFSHPSEAITCILMYGSLVRPQEKNTSAVTQGRTLFVLKLASITSGYFLLPCP